MSKRAAGLEEVLLPPRKKKTQTKQKKMKVTQVHDLPQREKCANAAESRLAKQKSQREKHAFPFEIKLLNEQLQHLNTNTVKRERND